MDKPITGIGEARGGTKEEILANYDSLPIRRSEIRDDQPNGGSELARAGSLRSRDLPETFDISAIDGTLKKYADILMHSVEGVSSRVSQLESRTRSIEQALDELRSSIGSVRGVTDGKLRQLDQDLREVKTGLQFIQDKQAKEDNPPPFDDSSCSSLPAQQPAQPANTVQMPAQSPPQPSNTPLPAQQPPQPQYTSQLPAQQPPQPQYTPQLPAQQPPQPQYMPQVPVLQSAQAQFTHQLPAQQSAQPQFTHQLPAQQPSLHQYSPQQPAQPHCTPPSPAQQQVQPQYTSQLPAHPEYTPHLPAQPPANAPPVLQPESHLPPQPYFLPPQASPSFFTQPAQLPARPPNVPQYSELPPYSLPSQQNPMPAQQPFPLHRQQPEGPPVNLPPHPLNIPHHQIYRPATLQSHYGPAVPDPYPLGPAQPALPTAKLLPQAQPIAEESGGSSQSGKRVPVNDVVERVAAMGFPKDVVRETVKKLTENGQSVDLNMVLDKLMNGSGDQPRKGWFGQG